MKFFLLLRQREALLRQARLANVVFAYHRLSEFARRIARANLQGEVHLRVADPALDRFWPTLHSPTGSQSVIEEHFLDEDIVELADILGFLSEHERQTSFAFRWEDLGGHLLPGLQHELARAGIAVADEPRSPKDPPFRRRR
ncbi:MAG: hypothetical protein Q8J74_07580 [Candidatus Didemnitutus sp.]|nr:hypothetical protein [Candidatus Didemnitutus sp.]